MKQCPFFAEEIQDAAIKCRWCGEALPQYTISECASSLSKPQPLKNKEEGHGPSKQSGLAWVAIVTLFVFSALGMFLSFADFSEPQPKDRIGQIKSQFNSGDGSHRQISEFVKSGMKNPASFEHVKTTYRDEGSHLYVEMTYRGTNGFGGVVTETYQANVSIDGRILGAGQ